MGRNSEQYKVEREIMGNIRAMEGVLGAEVDCLVSPTHYLEYVNRVETRGGAEYSDMLVHVFALPEYGGPWEPPEGVRQMRLALGRARDLGKLPVPQDKPWCRLVWEPDGIPETVHRVVRKGEMDIDEWLDTAGLSERVGGNELLNLIQRHYHGGGQQDNYSNWFVKRLDVCQKLQDMGLTGVLEDAGTNVPLDTPSPNFEYLSNLFPTKTGSWFVEIFDLYNLCLGGIPGVKELLLREFSTPT